MALTGVTSERASLLRFEASKVGLSPGVLGGSARVGTSGDRSSWHITNEPQLWGYNAISQILHYRRFNSLLRAICRLVRAWASERFASIRAKGHFHRAYEAGA